MELYGGNFPGGATYAGELSKKYFFSGDISMEGWRGSRHYLKNDKKFSLKKNNKFFHLKLRRRIKI